MADDRLYEASQKEYWDYTSTLETAERKGEIKGLQQGVQQGVRQEKKETIHRLQAMGLSVESSTHDVNTLAPQTRVAASTHCMILFIMLYLI